MPSSGEEAGRVPSGPGNRLLVMARFSPFMPEKAVVTVNYLRRFIIAARASRA